MQRIGIGTDDFKELRTTGAYFVDKTPLIRAVVEGGKCLLLPRPRRFGKTLNLSMLRYFFDRRDAGENARLFDGLTVSRDPEMMAHQGRYPVIALSLKDMKSESWETTREKLVNRIARLYQEHAEGLEGLPPREKETCARLERGVGSEAELSMSLANLIDHLHTAFHMPAIVLIDEYDTPVIEAWDQGYYDRIMPFMRGWLGAALKHEAGLSLFRSVVTGILRVSKESLFSDLNNLDIASILTPGPFEDKFGFTQDEVDHMLADFSLPELAGPMKTWYNGYRFGNTVIYNPWSVLNALHNHPAPMGPHWLNTGSNSLVVKELEVGGLPLKADLEKLLAGEELRCPLEEKTVFADLEKNSRTIWSFLVFVGYLRAEDPQMNDVDQLSWRLSIPNQEVRLAFYQFIERVFAAAAPESLRRFLDCFLDAKKFGELESVLQELVLGLLSSHDLAKRSEAVFHAFFLGLLAGLRSIYKIRSNAESGYGRADIMMRPLTERHHTAYVIEFKSVPAKSGVRKAAEAAAERALTQIDGSGYVTALRESGIPDGRIKRLAVVLAGKRVAVR